MKKEATNIALSNRIKELEAALSNSKKELATLRGLFGAFMDGAESVLGHQSFLETARTLFDLCKDQTGAQSGYVALLNEEGSENEVLFLDAGGLPCSVNPNLPMPIRGLRGQVYATSETAYDNDFENSEWMRFMPKGHVQLRNVMFAPMIYDNKTVGLIGLANKTTDFDEKDALIATTFGKLAAIALREAKYIDDIQKTEISLRQSEKKYRTLVDTMNEGVCLHELVYDDQGKPVDYRILDVNPAYEHIIGVSQNEIVSKNASEVYGTGVPPFFNVYAHVAETGEPTFLEVFWPPLKKHFLISAFSPQKGQFATVFSDITDRKLKEEQLRTSEEYLSVTLNSIGDAVITTDTLGRVVQMNPIAEALTGWKLSDAKGQDIESVFNIVNEKTREKIENPVSKVIREGGIVGLANHTVLIEKNGTEYFIDDSGAPIHDKNGELIGVVLIFRDITEQKQAERELSESKEWYQLLFNSINDAVFIHSISPDGTMGNFIQTNNAACKQLGYSAKELMQMTPMDIDEPGSSDTAVKVVQRLLENRSVTFEMIHKSKDGQTIPVEISSRLFTQTDEPLAISIARDISNRKKNAAERERLITAIEQAGESIVITDPEGRIQYTNPAFQQITGYARQEVEGKNPRFLKSGHHDNAFYKVLWDTILSGNRWTNQLINKRKDGSFYTSECAISPVKNEMGEILNFVWIAKDITKEVQLEKRISQAQRIESIGNLAGGIAHDFNNILFPIVGLSEMLMEDFPADTPVHESAKEIHRAAKRGSDLSKRILAFSRQSTHKLPVRLQKVLNEALKLSRSTIPSSIEIIQDVQHDCGFVMTDPTQFHQVVMNLITNAYHAVEQTNGSISIRLKEITLDPNGLARSTLTKGRYVRLTVADTGCGIEPAIVDKIFEPYFTTKVQGKGTGLGLAVVYGIVKENGGDIKAYSEPGNGTTFSVYLPRMENSPTFLPDQVVAPDQTGTERILLVDDEEPIVRMEKQMLERLGYQVSERTSSTDALKAFRTSPDTFDLVITDMAMPHMTGVQLAKEMNAIRPDLPILICTGFSERLDESKVKSFGVKGILMKPVIKSEMAKTVRRVLDASKHSIPK